MARPVTTRHPISPARPIDVRDDAQVQAARIYFSWEWPVSHENTRSADETATESAALALGCWTMAASHLSILEAPEKVVEGDRS
jgi:hypothetical protein